MTSEIIIPNDNNIDDHVDDQISNCLNLNDPKSFFLFAGAGSGKTRSLVNALETLCKDWGNILRIKGKKVGVITFTNAACNEIVRRLNFTPLLDVSTIHSFVWNLIQGYNQDIKVWKKKQLESDLIELNEAQAKGRPSKAYNDRQRSIAVKTKKLEDLSNVKKFVYNPNGDNKSKASLSHSDVIKIGAEFLNEKPLMRSLLINKYPVILIDESQDTNKYLLEAFLRVQKSNPNKFCLGLLGDTMQRIYSDGKIDIEKELPEDWAKPVKVMNHRCPKRVVTLINKIRSSIDDQEQKSRNDKAEGFVRLFIANREGNKQDIENLVIKKMAEITGDKKWSDVDGTNKTLILEHHMAATRMGFAAMFEPLYKAGDTLRTGLLDGSLPGLKLFWEQILPLVQAYKGGDKFVISTIMKKHSPLLNKESFQKVSDDQTILLKAAKKAVDDLIQLWAENNDPKFIDVLLKVEETKIFDIPESLKIIALRNNQDQAEAKKEVEENKVVVEEENEEDNEDVINAWDGFLQTNFSQIELYHTYVSGNASFDTHQGVKGLEFPRVIVVIDDTESRGFMFSYDKLFGTKAKTDADIRNEKENNDTSTNRTRRLFYVTCSRAEESLAIVAYTEDPGLLESNVIAQNWFNKDEIIHLQ